MIPFPQEIEDYAERHTRALSDLHAKVWQETCEKQKSPKMMVGPLEGALLGLLVRITAAKRVLEIGIVLDLLREWNHKKPPSFGYL